MNYKKIVYIVMIIWFILGISIYVFNYFNAKENIKNNVNENNEVLKPESIDDIPPNIIDNVAPDLEQNFKSQAKDFEVHDINGNMVKLSDYKGKNIVLNFWASWCDSSLTEIPCLIEAMKKYDGQVEFIMINLPDGEKETIESAQNYIEENNFDIVPLFDDHFDARINYNVTTMPRTIFIDKKGLIQKSIKGVLNEEILDTQIQNLLDLE